MGHCVSAFKTKQISTEWKCRLHLEKQVKIKVLGKKTGRKTFSSFKKSQNHLKNLLGLFSPESPFFCEIVSTTDFCIFWKKDNDLNYLKQAPLLN